jgi:deazaflavin-dependent oxidoreductase (nitroreductase family)
LACTGFRPAFCAADGSWSGCPGAQVGLPSERGQARAWSVRSTGPFTSTTGHRSGKRRSTPLVYGTDQGTLIVVASNRGGDQARHWFKNLEANPDMEVWTARHKASGRARIIEPDATDFERLWKLMDVVNFGRYGQVSIQPAATSPRLTKLLHARPADSAIPAARRVAQADLRRRHPAVCQRKRPRRVSVCG